MVGCPGAQLTNIVARNVRGPFPAGQCVQVGYSDGAVLDNFFCQNDIDVAWPEDSISAYRSSDVEITNGVVEGSNAPTGICVMYEGSSHEAQGGLIQNVEARYCQGCFSGYPISGLYQTGNTCAAPVCKSTEPLRGGKDFVNLWTAGDNVRDGVYASDITVADSWYYKPCDESEGRLYWESRKGEIFTNGGPDITELLDWTEKPEFQIEFPWDDCGFEPPSYDCNDFPWQEIGSTLIRINVNDANDTIYEPMFGSCWPEEGY